MTAKYAVGTEVEWTWGGGKGTARVEEVFTSKVTRIIKGKKITRNASPDEPAYMLRQDDRDRVLKSQSELGKVLKPPTRCKEEQMVKDHGPQIKDDKTYEALRDKGASKEKAARIANAKANPGQNPSKKGGQSPKYEDWTVDDLQQRAREIGIEGRSGMKKDQLIEALRNH